MDALFARLFYKEPVVLDRASGKRVQEMIAVSQALGQRYESPESKKEIARFIKEYGVQLDEIEKPVEEYQTLNEFFARKLNPGARPIFLPADEGCAVQPADARLVTFNSQSVAQEIWIKGKKFGYEELLGCNPGNKQHAIAVARLAPTDYHRFHSPISGELNKIKHLGSELFSVKAVAVNSRVAVLSENKRVVLEIHSEPFGTVWVVAIGAAHVGSIKLSVELKQKLEKGQELGWFQYGGSSVVIIFDSARIEMDDDIISSSRKAYETLVKVGTSLGRGKFNDAADSDNDVSNF